jgi:AraC family transcriptional regulator
VIRSPKNLTFGQLMAPKKTFAHPKRIAIKNMVCDRCVRVVREELESLGFHVTHVALGEATIVRRRGRNGREEILQALRRNGFDLLDDRKSRIVQNIKTAVIALVRSPRPAGTRHLKISAVIEREVGLDYHYLSTLFSSMENVTIEKYVILQKIEWVKELLRYDELSLKEIAFQLGYSSLAHLSSQFRKVTGMSARTYKKLKDAHRVPLDNV